MSIVRRCQELATSNPEAVAFTFLVDGDRQERSITRGELDARARAVAAELLARGLGGRRVLLLYVPGLDFIVGLLGCFYAGAIAVPAYPPEPGRLPRTLPRLAAIIKDCAPALVLTTGELLAMAPFAFNLAPELAAAPWASSEEWAARGRSAGALPTPLPEDLAFLQYTSGSTATPKGVMVAHDNLTAQLEQMSAYSGLGSPISVSWLPFYHDLGLIGFILFPLWFGARSILMSPLDFMKRPSCWLEAIDEYRAEISPAPPFALDLCARKLRPGDLHGLDLSCWRMVGIGAEPIHRATLDRFSELLRPLGFRPDALAPGYGLAEAVLLVTLSRKGEPFLSNPFSAAALREGRVVPVAADAPDARILVSSGQALREQQLEIVDPATSRRSGPDCVGEVWVAGPNVTRGYWNRPADSAATFAAELADGGEGPFLRTGDLGFVHEGQLYIVSRIKDLIIIRGKNHHPSDIEQSALASHPLLRPNGCAAFSIDEGTGEALVVVAEVSTRELPAGELCHPALLEIDQAIRRAVGEQHELMVHTVVLLEPGQLPKTSSGKIMRQPARGDLLAGRLVEVARFGVKQVEERGDSTGEAVAAPASRSEASLVEWLSSWLARRLRIAPEAIAPDQPFIALGLDSKEAVAIAGELASVLDQPLAAAALYDHPSVAALARHLAVAAPARDDAQLAAASRSPACAVLLAGGGAERPLFLVPGLFGVLTAFSHLSRELSSHMPIWGLDLPVHRGLPSPASVTALAERYADELCAIPGAAPHRLVGYCSGGMVALEVFRKLLERGERVEKLVLLDAPYLDAQRTDLARLRLESKLATERHVHLTLEQAMRLTVRYVVGKQLAFGEGEDLVEQMVTGGTANLTAFQGYEPRPLAISATLVSASERVRFPLYEEDAARNAQRWSQLFARPPTVLAVPGNHHSMLQPPHVTELARRILTELAHPDSAGQE